MIRGLWDDMAGRAIVLLAAGAAGLLLSVMLTTYGLLRGRHGSPGRRALAHWMPIAVTAVVATALRHGEIALGVIFGTSVAALSTVIGFITLVGPANHVPPSARRIWLFLPVVALLAFVIGFRSHLDAWDAMILLAQGALALVIWRLPRDKEHLFDDWDATSHPAPALRWTGWTMLLVAAVVAAESAWAATRGALALYDAGVPLPPVALGATALSIVLAMPMISTGTPPAAEGRAWEPLTAQVGVVLLNLGALLPLTIILSMFTHWMAGSPAATQPAWVPLLYSRSAWRVGAVSLVILSFLFVPASQDKLRFDRQFAGWLIAGYCVYLLLMLAWPLLSRGS